MEFRVLGPLEAAGEDGPLQLGGPKQRAILAHLILRPNRLVSAGTLIVELWGDEPPETARNTLQTYVYRLRKVIGDARIEAGSGGYLLHADPDEIDVARFERLVKEAEVSLSVDPSAALELLNESLALWRGDALADLADESSLRGEIARLEELRLAAVDLRVWVMLQLGQHSGVISELEALTARHPLRERFWAHLMIALYRTGRQAEALDVYRRAREVLADQLGADPSPELQHVHQQILRQDVEPSPAAPALDVPDTGAPEQPGVERGSDEGLIQTFLIADIRGYSRFSQDHGDEAAGRLAARYAKLTTEVIEARGGTVLELTGDEALCVFSTTRRAIRAAIDLQARFVAETESDPTLPLPVGIGIDTGEAVPVGGGFRGRALNLASRLCGAARAGEILATREALHMAGRMDGVHVEDRGFSSFKNIPEPVGVVRVTGEGQDSGRWFASHLPSAPPSTAEASRRRRRAIAAVAAVAVVLIIAALLQIVGEEPAHATFQPGIAIIDQVTGEGRASIATSEIRQPAEVIYAGESFWVHNLDPNSFVEIDPTTGRLVTQIAAPFQDVGTFTVDGDTLWVTGPYISKIDIGLRREVDHFEVPEQATYGVVVAEGSLWVTVPSTDSTLRLDPATGRVDHRFDLQGSLSLAYGDGSVWVAGWTAPFGGFTGGGGVNRIDPETNGVTKTELVLPVGCCAAAAGGGFGWTADPTKGVVYKIDQSGDVVDTRSTGRGAAVGSFDDDIVWVANTDVGTVSGVDTLTGARRTFRFEHPILGVAAGAEVLAVTLGPGQTYEDVIAGLDGTVARLFIPSGRLARPDPATLFGDPAYWVESATCAKLLSHPGAPAPDGWTLQPEVAASMPDISPDGRTYTFTIRPGFRFSPPSNEPIDAETFRYSIERALSRDLRGPGHFFVWDIEGEGQYRQGEADHISGLRAKGDILTIRLVRPSPEFLDRLAVPFFCPVPTDTPLVPGVVGADASYPHRAPQAVPSAGPYYIADHLDGEYTILKPNPNYAGPRERAFDAIVLREGVDPGIAVGLIEGGSWDGIIHVFDARLDPTGPVAQKYGIPSESGEALQYYATPSPLTGLFAFNTSRPTFADPDVRRAVALAIDRESLAALWGHVPSDQLLPPAMPGFEDRDLYALDGSGLDEARALMKGRTLTALMGIPENNERFRREAELVRSSLAPIGISVEIEAFPDLYAAVRAPGAEIDLIGLGNTEPFADPVSFLYTMFFYNIPPPSWLPEGVAEQVRALSTLTGAKRRRASAALADRLATDDVPVAVDLYGVIPTLLSSRLGCRVFPPFGFGVDLAALCPSQA